MGDEIDDFRDLLQRVCQGSEEAARGLVKRHGDSVRRIVRILLNHHQGPCCLSDKG